MSSFSPVFGERAKIIGVQCALATDPNSPPCDHQILRWTLEMRREWRGGNWCRKCRAGDEGLGSLLVMRTPSHCRGNTPEEVKNPSLRVLQYLQLTEEPFWGFTLRMAETLLRGQGWRSYGEGSEVSCPASSWTRLTAPSPEASRHQIWTLDLRDPGLLALVPVTCLVVA